MLEMKEPLKIYLAGPTVFYPDALERGKHLKELCFKYGFIGLFPLDNEISTINKKDMARQIYDGNINLINSADIVVADVNFFRGYEPDSGTMFEIGYATALKKPVYGYIDSMEPLVKKIRHIQIDQEYFDDDGMIIENFGLPINLMIGMSTTIIEGNFEMCLQKMINNI